MGCEVARRSEFTMQAVEWVPAKLQGDTTAASAGEWAVAKLQGDKPASLSCREL